MGVKQTSIPRGGWMDHIPAQSRTRKLHILPRNYKTCSVRILLYILIMAAIVYFLQSKLIYFPAKYSIAQLIQAADQHALTLWPTSDTGYRGLVTSGSTGGLGTVIVFHGNGGSALNRLHYVAALEPLGFKVILAEYPGYGARDGRLSERALVADARATVRLAENEFDGPLYIWGESLGSAVATAVAADTSLSIEGLALITPFTSLPDVAQSIYWFLPARWLVRDKYNNVANLRGFNKPVAILMADRDELIPRDQAQELYDSLTTRKKMWIFEDSGHNTWPPWPEENWWQEVADFIGGTISHGGAGQ
jgi:alpha-beta hydrolase superfamily lysophospholipase